MLAVLAALPETVFSAAASCVGAKACWVVWHDMLPSMAAAINAALPGLYTVQPCSQAENEVEQQEWMQMLQASAHHPAVWLQPVRFGGCCGATPCYHHDGRAAVATPLQGVIACLLSGAVAHDSLPTRPARPTHSRS